MLGCLLLCQRNTRLCQEKFLLFKIHYDLSEKYKALSGEYLKNTLLKHIFLKNTLHNTHWFVREIFKGFVWRIAEHLLTCCISWKIHFWHAFEKYIFDTWKVHFDYTLCFPEKFQGFVGRIAEQLQTAGDIPSWVELPVFHRSNISLSAQVHRSRPNLLSYEAFQDLVKRISEHLSKLDGASFLFLHKSNIPVLARRNVG